MTHLILYSCVQFLLEQGADVHCKNSYGYTALLWSAQQGNLACLRCLVEQGADIHAKTKWGETALVWATRKGAFRLRSLPRAKISNPEGSKRGWCCLFIFLQNCLICCLSIFAAQFDVDRRVYRLIFVNFM